MFFSIKGIIFSFIYDMAYSRFKVKRSNLTIKKRESYEYEVYIC